MSSYMISESPSYISILLSSQIDVYKKSEIVHPYLSIANDNYISISISPCETCILLLSPNKLEFYSISTRSIFTARPLPDQACAVAATDDGVFVLLKDAPKILAVGLLDWKLLQTVPETAMNAVVFSAIDLSHLLASSCYGTSDAILYVPTHKHTHDGLFTLALFPHGLVKLELDARGKAQLVWSATLPPHFRLLGSRENFVFVATPAGEVFSVCLKSGKRQEISCGPGVVTVVKEGLVARKDCDVYVYDVVKSNATRLGRFPLNEGATVFPDGWYFDGARLRYFEELPADEEVQSENTPKAGNRQTSFASPKRSIEGNVNRAWYTPRQFIVAAVNMRKPSVSHTEAQSMPPPSGSSDAACRLVQLKAEVAKGAVPTERQVNEWLELSREISDPEFAADLTHKLLKSLAQLYPEFPVSMESASIARLCRWLVCSGDRSLNDGLLLAQVSGVVSVQELLLEARGDSALEAGSPLSLLDCCDDEIPNFLPDLSSEDIDAREILESIALGNSPSDPTLIRWALIRLESDAREAILEALWRDVRVDPERRSEIFRLCEITHEQKMSTPRRKLPKLSRCLFNSCSLVADDFQLSSAEELLPKFIRHSGFNRLLLPEFCTKFGLPALQGDLCWLRLVLEEADSSAVLREAEALMSQLRASPEVLESLLAQQVIPALLERDPPPLDRLSFVLGLAGKFSTGLKERCMRLSHVVAIIGSIEGFSASTKLLATATVEETVEFLGNEVLSDPTKHSSCMKLVEAVDTRAVALFNDRLLEACPVHFELPLLKEITKTASVAQLDRLLRASFGPKKVEIAKLLSTHGSLDDKLRREIHNVLFKDALKSAGIAECSDVGELLFDQSLSPDTRVGQLVCASGIDVKQLLRTSIIGKIEELDLTDQVHNNRGIFDLVVPVELATAIRRLSDLRGSDLWIWLCRKLLIIAGDEHRDCERRLIAFTLVFNNFECDEIDQIGRISDVQGLFESLMYLRAMERLGLEFTLQEFLTVDKIRLAAEIIAAGNRNVKALQVAAALAVDFELFKSSSAFVCQLTDALKLTAPTGGSEALLLAEIKKALTLADADFMGKKLAGTPRKRKLDLPN